jgi:hypothetical protein
MLVCNVWKVYTRPTSASDFFLEFKILNCNKSLYALIAQKSKNGKFWFFPTLIYGRRCVIFDRVLLFSVVDYQYLWLNMIIWWIWLSSRMDDIEPKWKIMRCYERLSAMLDEIHKQLMIFNCNSWYSTVTDEFHLMWTIFIYSSWFLTQ